MTQEGISEYSFTIKHNDKRGKNENIQTYSGNLMQDMLSRASGAQNAILHLIESFVRKNINSEYTIEASPTVKIPTCLSGDDIVVCILRTMVCIILSPNLDVKIEKNDTIVASGNGSGTLNYNNVDYIITYTTPGEFTIDYGQMISFNQSNSEAIIGNMKLTKETLDDTTEVYTHYPYSDVVVYVSPSTPTTSQIPGILGLFISNNVNLTSPQLIEYITSFGNFNHREYRVLSSFIESFYKIFRDCITYAVNKDKTNRASLNNEFRVVENKDNVEITLIIKDTDEEFILQGPQGTQGDRGFSSGFRFDYSNTNPPGAAKFFYDPVTYQLVISDSDKDGIGFTEFFNHYRQNGFRFIRTNKTANISIIAQMWDGDPVPTGYLTCKIFPSYVLSEFGLSPTGYGSQSFVNNTEWLIENYYHVRYFMYIFQDNQVTTALTQPADLNVIVASEWTPIAIPTGGGIFITNSPYEWNVNIMGSGVKILYTGEPHLYKWSYSFNLSSLNNNDTNFYFLVFEEDTNSTAYAVGYKRRSTSKVGHFYTEVTASGIYMFKKNYTYTIRAISEDGNDVIIENGDLSAYSIN